MTLRARSRTARFFAVRGLETKSRLENEIVKNRLGGFICAIAALSCGGGVLGQIVTQIENFEYATSDVAAAAGITDITDFENTPTFYINGDNGDGGGNELGASEGLFALGTDAEFGASGFFVPGSFIGCRREISTDLFPLGFVPLQYAYGDPNVPGPTPADRPLSDLTILADMYGHESFGEGLFGTHLWINLIDLEGERFNFMNFFETALFFNDYTLDVPVGDFIIEIDPQSLIDVPDGDRLLTEIAAFEMLIQDDDDPPTGFGAWYIDNLRIVEIQPEIIPGDFDSDGDVDVVDVAAFADCFGGVSSTNTRPECETFDFDADGDIDLADFAPLQTIFTGS